MKRNRREGFTLAELLVVVGIIGILVAVSIPIFASNKTEAELATCQANRRALRAEMVIEYLADTYSSMNAAFSGIYNAHKEEYVCPNKGDFSWESTGEETGRVVCSYHDGSGNPGGGGEAEPDGPSGFPDDFPVINEGYWPTLEDMVNNNQWNKTITPGVVFQYNGSYYYNLQKSSVSRYSETSIELPEQMVSSGDGLKIDPQRPILEYTGQESKSVTRGDICMSMGSYHIYIAHASTAQSPEISPGLWRVIPKNGGV